MFVRLIAAAALTLAPLAAFAQEEWKEPHVESAKEHRIVKFFPQSSVRNFEVMDFDAHDMIVGLDRKNAEPVKKTLEGRVTKYFSLHKPGTSALAILRNYEHALKKAGFVTLISGKGGDSMPGMPINFDQTYGAFRLDANGAPAVYVSVVGSGDAASPSSEVVIVDIKSMEQQLEANAEGWFEELNKSGRVAVYGINFDTGKATLRPDSAAVLEEVRKLAAAHPEMKLRIEGHTDNAGIAASNRKLSEERATAVKNWLVSKGVKAAQLVTSGLGDTKPVADNGTEAGRAQNRRVELVKL